MNVRWIVVAFDIETFVVIEPGIRSNIVRSFSKAEVSSSPILMERSLLGFWDLKHGPLAFNLKGSTDAMRSLATGLVNSGWLAKPQMACRRR